MALIIELDGGQHAERHDADLRRTDSLELQGYRVLRFWNDELINKLEVVSEIIHRDLER